MGNGQNEGGRSFAETGSGGVSGSNPGRLVFGWCDKAQPFGCMGEMVLAH
jgi:hypothetical protein